ncbi:MAG: ABC transporter permease, partial [Pseudomonadota bacterium]
MTGTALISALAVWAAGWFVNARLANSAMADSRIVKLAVPAIFGITLLIMWELLVRMLEISPVILPPPTMIAERFASELTTLWADFEQTIIKGAMTGYIIGMLAAFAVAILADRSKFLTRGILPVGSFM